MNKKNIVLSYEGKEYTLEFTRKSVAAMEGRGFEIDKIATKVATMVPELFAGAFLANHKFVKRDVIDTIYSQIADKEKLLAKLVDLYQEPIMALISDNDNDEEDTENLIQWGANF